jgi:hypothetical protein
MVFPWYWFIKMPCCTDHAVGAAFSRDISNLGDCAIAAESRSYKAL